MRAITQHFTDTVDIYNLVDVVDGKEYTLVAEGVKCHVQPQDGNYIEDSTGMYGKSYLVFCDYRTDIEEGTHLKLKSGEETYEMRVVETETFYFGGLKRHTEARCRIFDTPKHYGN